MAGQRESKLVMARVALGRCMMDVILGPAERLAAIQRQEADILIRTMQTSA